MTDLSRRLARLEAAVRPEGDLEEQRRELLDIVAAMIQGRLPSPRGEKAEWLRARVAEQGRKRRAAEGQP